MQLHEPFMISARLRPALKIGEAILSLLDIEYGDKDRATFVWDFPGGREIEDGDLRSGRQGFDGTVDIFEHYLLFLSYVAESRSEEAEGMFPPEITRWARDNRRDVETAHMDLIDENGDTRTDLVTED